MLKKIIPIFFLFFLIFSCTISKNFERPQKKAIRGSILYYSLVAQRHYDNRDYEKSIYNYQKIIDKFSEQKDIRIEDFAWTYYEIGFNYFKLKDYDKALENFEIVLSDYSNVLSATILSRQRINDINKIYQRPNDEL